MTDLAAGRGRSAGTSQALSLILALTLPVTPLLALAPNLPQLFTHFALVPNRDLLVPMVLTLPSMCIALLAPMAGTVIDRLGRKRVLLFAVALFTVCGMLPFWLQSLRGILTAQFGVGLAEAIIMPAGNTLLGDYFASEARQKWLGMQGILGAILATAIVLGGGALGTLSWQAPFLINSLGAVAFVWLLIATWEPARPAAAGARVALGQRFPWSPLLPILAITVPVSVLYYVQAVELGLIFAGHGAQSPVLISLLTTLASVGVIAGGWLYRREKYPQPARNLALILCAYAVGLAGLGLAHGYWAALPFGIVAQFGNGLVIPVLVGWALRTLDFRYRGRGMGLWTTCFFSGQFLSPMLLALLMRTRGEDLLAVIVLIGAGCAVLSLIACIVAARRPLAVAS